MRQRPAAQVAGRLEQRVRQPLQPRVDRQDHVRQPQVRQREDDRDRAVARAVEPERLEQPGEHAGVRLHHRLPGVDLHQVRRPQRRDDQGDQHAAPPRRDDLGHEERHRHARAPRRSRSPTAAIPTVRSVAPMYTGSVRTSWKFCRVKVRTTSLVNSSTEKNDVAQQRRERREVDDDEPGERQGQQRDEADPGVPEERGRQPPLGRAGPGRRRGAAPVRCDGRRHASAGDRAVQLLRRSLQAFDQSAYGRHLTSVRPSRQSDCGVAQNQIFLKYVSSVAW